MLLRSTGQTSIKMTMIIAHLRTPVTKTQRTVKSLKPSGPACVSPLDIPYFGAADKHSRGAWPVVARLASLPDGLWDRFEFAHLYALEATEYWYTDVETGKVRRKRKCVL